MEPTIVVAIITSAVSIISLSVATYAGFRLKHVEGKYQRAVAELNTRSQLDIERFKADQTSIHKAYDQVSDEVRLFRKELIRGWITVENAKAGLISFLETKSPSDLRVAVKELESFSKMDTNIFGFVSEEFVGRVLGEENTGMKMIRTVQGLALKAERNRFPKDGEEIITKLIRELRETQEELRLDHDWAGEEIGERIAEIVRIHRNLYDHAVVPWNQATLEQHT